MTSKQESSNNGRDVLERLQERQVEINLRSSLQQKSVMQKIEEHS